MTRIVPSTYRCTRPPRKRKAQVAAIACSIIVIATSASLPMAAALLAKLASPAAAQTPPLTRDVVSPAVATPRVNLPLSPVVRVGDVIYVSGQVERDAPDITGQATRVLKKVQAVVEAAGATMATVDKCTVFLTRQEDFAPMNEVWAHVLPERSAGTDDGDRRGARARGIPDRSRMYRAPVRTNNQTAAAITGSIIVKATQRKPSSKSIACPT